MATMTRSDVHRPSVLDPADYRCVGGCDAHTGDQYSFEFDWALFADLADRPDVADRDYRDGDGIPWAEVEHSAGEYGTFTGGCDHCGQRRIRYWAFYLHVPSGEVIAVGNS